MDERKKKLEELKAKNAMLKTQITKSTAPSSGAPTTSTPSQLTSTNSKADEVIKSVISSRTNVVGMDVLKQQSTILKDNMNRYRTDILSVTKQSESFIKQPPEMYEESCQVDPSLFNQEDSDDENYKKKKVKEEKKEEPETGGSYKRGFFKKLKMSAVNNKNKSFFMSFIKNILNDPSLDFDEPTKETPGLTRKKAYDEEAKKQMLTSPEMIDFLSNKSKVVERALGEKDVYDMFHINEEEEFLGNIDHTKSKWISSEIDFFDYEMCNSRAVTSLEWSLKVKYYNQLILYSIKSYYLQLIQRLRILMSAKQMV